MALTREEHHNLGDKVEFMIPLLTKHMNFLALNNVKFDMQWFDDNINFYKSIAA